MNYDNLDKLILDAQDGDVEAFGTLFTRYWSMAYYCCYKYLGNEKDAEDATQEVFITLHRRIHNLKHPRLFAKTVKWLAAEISRDFGERKKKQPDLGSVVNLEEVRDNISEEKEEFLPVELLEKKELRLELIRLIDHLPVKQREAIMLYYFNEMSLQEIADLTRSKPDTVSNRLFHAKKTLKQEIEKKMHRKEMGIMAATPVLTEVFRQEMNTLATPERQQSLWQGIASKLTASEAAITGSTGTAVSESADPSTAPNNSANLNKAMAGKSVGSLAGINVAIGTVCVAACISVTTMGLDLYAEAKGVSGDIGLYPVKINEEFPTAGIAAELDILQELQAIDSLQSFYRFVDTYQFTNSTGVATSENTDYVLYNRSFATMHIFVGYALKEGDFRLAYEVGPPERAIPESAEDWVLANLR